MFVLLNNNLGFDITKVLFGNTLGQLFGYNKMRPLFRGEL